VKKLLLALLLAGIFFYPITIFARGGGGHSGSHGSRTRHISIYRITFVYLPRVFIIPTRAKRLSFAPPIEALFTMIRRPPALS